MLTIMLSGGGDALRVVVILALFTVTFVVSGVLTYRLRKQKSVSGNADLEQSAHEDAVSSEGENNGH